ncbi:peptidase family m13 domain-containing protein [Ditylenchus destructor]|nr:peptidase family m13 domain-containing protein [Ditylenchus destructor]
MYLFYDACTNDSRRSHKKSMFLLAKLASMKESPTAKLPFTAEWLTSAYPFKAIYNHYINKNLRNASQNIVYFELFYDADIYNRGATYTHDPKNYIGDYNDIKYYSDADYRRYLTDILNFLMDDDVDHRVFPEANRNEEIQRRVDNFMVVEMERSKVLSFLNGTNSEDPFSVYNFMTLGEFQEKCTPKGMDWPIYFNNFVPPQRRAQGNSDNILDMTIAVENAESFAKIAQLIDNLDSQQLSDYLEWQIIFSFLPYMDKRFLEARTIVNNTILDQRVFCKRLTIENFMHQVDKLYIEKYYDRHSDEPIIETMSNYMVSAFREIVEESQWIDDKTKKRALEKLDLMQVNIGYVPAIYDKIALDKRYGQVKLTSDMSFSEMAFLMRKRDADYYMETLAQPGHSYYWTVLEANTYYHWWYNSMFIQAGFLQQPLYHSHFPDALKYGALGHMFGHEITHGYDIRGYHLNGNGEIEDWWEPETKVKYRERKQCLIDQYSTVKIQIDDNISLAINGEFTQGENIADHGGLRIAYRAWKSYTFNKNKSWQTNSKKIREMESYTDEQLFFIGSAFIRCEQHTRKRKIQLMQYDEHTMTPARVNVLMGNTPEFAKAFNCPMGSGMNPKDKCVVW